MGYFDADAEEMLEVYLLETRQLMEQLNGVLLEADKNKTFSEKDINTVQKLLCHDGTSRPVRHGA